MAELSPAAQAVAKAALDASSICMEGTCPYKGEEIAAAVLRAVADQGENLYDPHEGKASVVRVEHLLAIANELEAQP